MKIIFQIDGGIWKSVAGTAVCKAIRAQYPDDELVVITGYPDVFLCSDTVDYAYGFNQLHYFYRQYVEGKEFRTFLFNPYQGQGEDGHRPG